MLREVRETLVGKWILNIYQLNGTLLFKINQDSPNKSWLLIEPGRRMHLTGITYEREAQNRAFCRVLRKHFRDHKIATIEQHNFDRVVYLRAGPPEKQFTLVIELFGGGNAILLDPKNRIVSAMTFRRMRDRDIVRGAPFEFPPLRAKNPKNISQKELEELVKTSEVDIVRTLIRGYNMSGTTIEEILAQSKIKPKTPATKLSDKDLDKIFQTIIDYFETLTSGSLSPQIILDDKGEPVQVLPLDTELNKDATIQRFDLFNEALDAFYSTQHQEKSLDTLVLQYDEEEKRLHKLLEKQQEHLTSMETRAQKGREAANTIYQNLPLIEELLTTIRNARHKALEWDEIIRRLEIGKEQGVNAAAIVDKIDPDSGLLHIIIQKTSIALDIRLSATENADKLFARSKQLEKKVKGAQLAIDDTTQKLETLLSKKEEEVSLAQTETPLRRRKKQWFEKFRWFRTSKGKLVLGGRDANSNQQLIRKYLEEPDLFFHADLTGAPVVIVKTEKKKLTSEEQEEIAIFAISYSRAWRTGWSIGDVYWVASSQVSLSAPSGEYLPKGGVMVRGERNYLRNVPLRLAVGLSTQEKIPFFIAGPEEAILNQTKQIVRLIPGDTKISDIAKHIKRHFEKIAPEEMRSYIKAMNIDELIAILPPGSASFESKL
jgi:predicted ribosome quality control (RQC) complex YloA/Tae2 family protein